MPEFFYVENRAAWLELTRSPTGTVGRDLARRGRELQGLASRQVGRKTGKLATSITSNLTVDARGLVVRVGSSSRIALLHHQGSKPHEILPRKTRLLRFMHHGRIRYARRVWHPGTKPNRYLTSNLPRVVLR